MVETDALGIGVGVVLLQRSHPIAYFSKKIRLHLRKASAYVRELYAIVEAIKKWHYNLLGSHFLIRTDHISLKEVLA